MPKEKIKELVQQLRDEIGEQPAYSPVEKEKIESLINNIEDQIKDENFTDELNESLSDTITEFEARYPRLTAIINDVMTTLSNMGI